MTDLYGRGQSECPSLIALEKRVGLSGDLTVSVALIVVIHPPLLGWPALPLSHRLELSQNAQPCKGMSRCQLLKTLTSS